MAFAVAWSVDPARRRTVALYADGLDGDDLAFADGQANLLRWDSVPAGLAGKAIWVTVTVSDPVPAPEMGVAQRRYLLTLRENNRPTVWLADQAITAGQDFACDVAAEDLDPADVLSFSLSAPAGSTLPAGMTIDPQLGRIRWDDALEGSYELIVSVSDGVDTTSGSFRLDVLPDDRPPVVELSLSHRVADVGQRVRIWVIDSDDVGVTGRTLSIDGQPVALDGAGAAEFTVEGQFGHVFALEATARDAAGNVSLPATATLLIRNPDNRAPQVALTSPAAGAAVTALTEIAGSIVDPDGDLASYTIAITRLDSAVPVQVYPVAARPGEHLGNLVDTTLGAIDATVLDNGTYSVVVEAIDAEERVRPGGADRRVGATSKLGNFTFTFVDLELPVSGMPITITRTYDTLRYRNEQGGFGYGWTMDIANVKVDVIQRAAVARSRSRCSTTTAFVFTLPDAANTASRSSPSGSTPARSSTTDSMAALRAGRGQLSSTLRMSGGYPALLQAAGVYLDTAMGEQPGVQPRLGIYGIRATLRNGTKLYVDPAERRPRQLVDAAGQTLTFTSGGIPHSAGARRAVRPRRGPDHRDHPCRTRRRRA